MNLHHNHPAPSAMSTKTHRLVRAARLLSLTFCLSAASGCSVFGFLSPKGSNDPAKTGEAASDGTSANSGKSMEQLNEDLRKLVKTLDKNLSEDDAPLPAAELDKVGEYHKLLNKGGAEDGAFFAEHVHTYYKIENAWRGGTSKTAATIAKLVDAELVEAGKLPAGDSVKLNTSKGQCYYIFSHTRQNEKGHIEFHGKNGDTDLLGFRAGSRTITKSSFIRSIAKSAISGFCASKDIEVNVSAEIEEPGGAVGYVIAKAPREKFSKYLASIVEIPAADWCDADNWEQLWLDPIPGSVLYAKKGVYLVQRLDGVGGNWLTALNPEVKEARYTASDTQSQPKNLSFSSSPHFRDCPQKPNSHASAATQKIASCYQQLNNRYASRFNAAAAARESAPTLGGRVAAHRQYQALTAAKAREGANTCGKLQEQVHKKMSDAYRRIADHYSSGTVKLQFDRSAIQRKMHKGS